MPAKVQEIDPVHLKKLADNGQVHLVDVREHLEYKEEHIPKAQLHPFSKFNPKDIPDPFEKKVVFYCLSGKRANQASAQWAEYKGSQETYYLQGGLEAWKNVGFPTVINFEVERKVEHQAYILAGILVIIGSLLTAIFWEGFLIIPLLVGSLLVYSGVASHCFISYLLSKLPFNK